MMGNSSSAVTEVDAGPVEAFAEGRPVFVAIRGREVGVIRTASGTFHAVLNVCPHQGGPVCRGHVGGTMLPGAPGTLSYGLEDRVIACPWHGWEFDLQTGEALFGVSTKRLLTFPVVVRDGRVRVSTKPRRTAHQNAISRSP
jgi:nitrite reductase (NADH) small subunit